MEPIPSITIDLSESMASLIEKRCIERGITVSDYFNSLAVEYISRRCESVIPFTVIAA